MKKAAYNYYQNPKTQKPLWVIGGVLILLCMSVTLYFLLPLNKPTDKPKTNVAVPAQKTTTYNTVEGRYLFHGTVAWERAIERDARGNYDRPFSMLDTFDRQKYDAWIADLECPVTTKTVPYQTQVDSLQFNCPPAFNAAAKKYFDIFNLANNHTDDLGRDGFLETQKHLTDSGFQVYGGPDLTDSQNHCEVISLPIHLKGAGKTDQAALPVAFCAYHAVARSPTTAELESVRAYAKVMPVFAFAHLGVEYTATVTSQQQTLARDLVDAGAEFVIMNHPHWVQSTDVYKGKLIVYSTGNFLFDQLTYEEQRSASYDIMISAKYNDNIKTWIKLVQSCGAEELHDSCFAELPKNLAKPTFNYHYELVAGDERPPQRWIPRKADKALQADTERRANWQSTLQTLSQSQ
ncbi:MAG: CapA family protein [Candidatus Saccharimonadales bacterium]